MVFKVDSKSFWFQTLRVNQNSDLNLLKEFIIVKTSSNGSVDLVLVTKKGQVVTEKIQRAKFLQKITLKDNLRQQIFKGQVEKWNVDS